MMLEETRKITYTVNGELRTTIVSAIRRAISIKKKGLPPLTVNVAPALFKKSISRQRKVIVNQISIALIINKWIHINCSIFFNVVDINLSRDIPRIINCILEVAHTRQPNRISNSKISIIFGTSSYQRKPNAGFHIFFLPIE